MREFFESEFFEDIRRLFEKISEKFRSIPEPSTGFVLKAFIAIVALLSALSVSVIMLEADENTVQQTTEAEAVSTTEAEAVTMPVRGQLNVNILFGLDNEEEDGAHLLFVLSLDSETERSKIFFLEPSAVCKVNEIEGSLDYHLKNGGVSQLVLAVKEYMDIEIDRYLVGDEKAFVSLVKYMGDVEIDVKESISYNHNGLSYIIDKGVQVMTPDMLLKYLVYLCEDTVTYGETLRLIFTQFAKILFDRETSQQAQDNFGKVIGYFETNISALDFSENKLAVMKLAKELSLKLEAYNSLAQFKGTAGQQ
ncbi:MAG: LytR family transcriptional regulator [Ruminococcaceae bacterium]|nr:LytR family transcriptional regulator [Oscillospiraceae bacterium]